MTKKELWRKFMKTGRIADYLAYQRAKEQPETPLESLFSEELADEFIQNFDVDFPNVQGVPTSVDAEEYFDEDDPG